MTDARSKNAPLHKSFSKTHKTKFRTHYTFDSLSSIVDEVDEVDEVVQTSMFDSVATEDETPYCMNCFHDLEYDGFSHYHCNGCDSWFTKVEAESSI
jgi:hypothetical protein